MNLYTILAIKKRLGQKS